MATETHPNPIADAVNDALARACGVLPQTEAELAAFVVDVLADLGLTYAADPDSLPDDADEREDDDVEAPDDEDLDAMLRTLSRELDDDTLGGDHDA